jgi:RNA polymerase sigma factor (sigma-70 family)
VSPRLSDLLLSSQSDERLVTLARTGHERAFAVIVERYGPELQAMAQRLCSDGRGEDVVQQAFLSAFAALRSGCEVRHLRGWLYQIVRNAAGRSQTPICVPLDGTTASVNGLEDVVQQRALAMTALSEIARLPARQRQAMIGTALDGRARAEIANSMGLSEGAVRQLVHRARTTLRSAITAITPWPLARWLAAAGSDAPGPAEVAAGAGVASSGGLALKLGALLASGTFLTGAAVHLQAPASHRGDVRAAISSRGGLGVARARPATVASLAPGVAAHAALPSQPRVVGTAGAGVTRSGPAQEVVRWRPRGNASAGTVIRSEGSRVGGHDEGRGDRTDPGKSSGRSGRDGAGASTPPSSGPDTHSGGQDRGPHGGSGTDGGERSGGSSGGGSRSDDGATQMISDSHPVDSGVDGSDSRHGSDSGSSSLDASAASSSSDSGAPSGSSGDLALSGQSGSGSGSGSSDGGGTSGG